MSPYEIGSLVVAVVAIVISMAIPSVQYAYKKMQRPKLDIIPFDVQPLTLHFDLYGIYAGFRFSIQCENEGCVVKSIGFRVKRQNDGKEWIYSSKWISLKPIHSDWMFACPQQATISSSTLVHPIKIEAGKLEPLNVEFAALAETSHRSLINGICEAVDGASIAETTVDGVLSDNEVQVALDKLRESCMWTKGEYIAELTVRYDASGEVSRRFYFDVDESQATLLRDNVIAIAAARVPNELAGTRRQLQSLWLEVV